jgi:cytochrome P450
VDGLLQQVVIDEPTDAARRERFPAGAALEFADLEEGGREVALDRLREHEPVSWVPALGGWLVTGYAAAREMLGPRTGLTVEAHENLVRASLGHMMLTSDAESHTRQRAPFERPFRMREVGALFGGAIDGELDELLGAVRDGGGCELGQALAAPFAVRMTGRVLGLSFADIARIDGFYEAFAEGMVYDGNPERQLRADAAREELNGILVAEFARCRGEPDSSITSEVVNDGATELADDEIAAQLRVIMFGGIETIQSGIMNTILLLLEDPAQLDAVRAAPGLLENAVEESLRLIPPVSFIERWTPGEAEIGGIAIGEGEFIGVSVLAANRDPELFADPLRYHVQRDNARRHLSFSFGEHFCLGAHLARIEIRAAVRRLIALPGLRLVAAEPPSGFAFRRPATLELAWDQ